VRTVASFEHNGRSVHIRKVEQLGPRVRAYLYRAYIDEFELPVTWHNAAELEKAIRTLLDEGKTNGS
jgi:hypothetical protein